MQKKKFKGEGDRGRRVKGEVRGLLRGRLGAEKWQLNVRFHTSPLTFSRMRSAYCGPYTSCPCALMTLTRSDQRFFKKITILVTKKTEFCHETLSWNLSLVHQRLIQLTINGQLLIKNILNGCSDWPETLIVGDGHTNCCQNLRCLWCTACCETDLPGGPGNQVSEVDQFLFWTCFPMFEVNVQLTMPFSWGFKTKVEWDYNISVHYQCSWTVINIGRLHHSDIKNLIWSEDFFLLEKEV